MNKENKNEKIKSIKCYRCDAFVKIPDDYVGNPYTLLEVHYMIEHSIDLKTFDWDNPKNMYGDEITLDKIKKRYNVGNESEPT